MKLAGILLLIAGFLYGAFLTALSPTTVAWPYYALALAIGAAGLFTFKRTVHLYERSAEVLARHRNHIEESLDNILESFESVKSREIPTYDMRFEIDRLFRDDLDRFADARGSLIHLFSMQDYADVMSAFASGERYLNRVWSASTDGYEDEVRTYLERAEAQFREAHAHLETARAKLSGAAAMAKG